MLTKKKKDNVQVSKFNKSEDILLCYTNIHKENFYGEALISERN
jgi:hypothetical protein